MSVDEFLEHYKVFRRPVLEKMIPEWRTALEKMETEYEDLYGVKFETARGDKE